MSVPRISRFRLFAPAAGSIALLIGVIVLYLSLSAQGGQEPLFKGLPDEWFGGSYLSRAPEGSLPVIPPEVATLTAIGQTPARGLPADAVAVREVLLMRFYDPGERDQLVWAVSFDDPAAVAGGIPSQAFTGARPQRPLYVIAIVDAMTGDWITTMEAYEPAGTPAPNPTLPP